MKSYKVKKSNIDNKGLYAAKNIKTGTKIIYYKGKIITKKETDRNPKYDNEKAIYLFNLNSRYDLDGDFEYNTARLINHSCNPNCEVDGKGLKLWIFALRDIKKGEELSYDYGFGFDPLDPGARNEASHNSEVSLKGYHNQFHFTIGMNIGEL